MRPLQWLLQQNGYQQTRIMLPVAAHGALSNSRTLGSAYETIRADLQGNINVEATLEHSVCKYQQITGWGKAQFGVRIYW